MGYILIIGATSDIARSVAEAYAAKGYDLCLAARRSGDLTDFAGSLEARYGRRVVCTDLDVVAYDTHRAFYESLDEKPVGVIQAVGYLGDQLAAQQDFEEAQAILNANLTGVVSLLNIVANDFEARREGFIVGISSVAGDRGKKSNYIYGSAKAGLTAYLSGLRNRLASANVHVLTVKPGFVETKMTEKMDLPPLLTKKPDQVAAAILRAQQSGRNEIYVGAVWRWMMVVIRAIPEALFKRLNM